MNNISDLVGVKWFLGNDALSVAISGGLNMLLNPGIPMNDTKNIRLQIGELGESILGPNLLGFQVGNEPDLYGR
jgi:hypothetical protein